MCLVKVLEYIEFITLFRIRKCEMSVHKGPPLKKDLFVNKEKSNHLLGSFGKPNQMVSKILVLHNICTVTLAFYSISSIEKML